MRRYDKERPGTGGAEAAVNRARSEGRLSRSWEWFWWWNHISRPEMIRALYGVDGPDAWCGERNARLRRMIERLRTYPKLRLP